MSGVVPGSQQVSPRCNRVSPFRSFYDIPQWNVLPGESIKNREPAKFCDIKKKWLKLNFLMSFLSFLKKKKAQTSSTAIENPARRRASWSSALDSALEMLSRLSSATVRKFVAGNRLLVFYTDLHRQGFGHRVTDPIATASGQCARCFPRGGHFDAGGSQDSSSVDWTPCSKLATSGSCCRLLLSWSQMSRVCVTFDYLEWQFC